ncbi:MAG: vWA domain-containing protein [Planctomycetota bacterium]
MPEPQTEATSPAGHAPDESRPPRLGESEGERAVKRVAPWFVSIALHAGMLVLGMAITWTVAVLGEDDDPVRIVADFDAVTFDPVVLQPAEQTELTDPQPRETVQTPTVDELLREDLRDFDLDPTQFLSTALSRVSPDDFAPRPEAGSARFLGLSATNARAIVYVIDASGSMIPYLPIVVQELARSMERLSPEQRFAIVFFQEAESIVVPPASRLVAATDETRLAALRWIDENVIPRGGTNPLVAIEEALRLKPDVIFLLSQNITGYGRFEIDQADLLALLDQRNPIVGATDRRRTQIQCIQFLDPDPLDTMRRIAEHHGGPGGYKFLDREELGFSQP